MSNLFRQFRPAVAVAVFVAACSSDSVTNPSAPMGLELSLSPSEVTARISDTVTAADRVQLAVSATSFNAPVATPAGVEWTTSDTTIATVDQNGLVQPLRVGTATIQARINSAKAKTTVTVVNRVATLAMTPSAGVAGLALDTVNVSASALDATGKPATGTIYTFTVDDPTIATVAKTGNATARLIFLKAGTTKVNVRAGGQATSVTVNVQPRDFVGVTALATAQNALTISAGEDATCGLLPLNRGYCFGQAGLIGIAKDTACFNDVPAQGPLPCTLIPLRIAGALAMTGVSVGDSVACGTVADGHAYCWGSQKYGQLGNGIASTGSSATPSLVLAVPGTSGLLRSVSAGGNHACGIAGGASGGPAYCWGQDSLFQLGGGDQVIGNSTTPIPVSGGVTYIAISAGRTHTCALRTDGAALCWGDNRRGQLGNGTTGAPSDSPVAVSAPAFVAISAGGYHTCGLTASGSLFCWGGNDSGQVGRGGVGGDLSTPAAVAGTFKAVSAGRYSTCAVATSGAAQCWGSNEYGQLGDGGRGVARGSPATVVGGHSDFVAIAVGKRHACAVAADGAYCWGSNFYGALGNGLQALIQTSPVKTATPQ